MITTFGGFSDEQRDRLRAWVLSGWKPGIGRVQETVDDSDERALFLDMAVNRFEELGVPTERVRTWFNVMPPDERTGYDDGYPHVHHDTLAMTMVYYIDPGDAVAALDIFDEPELDDHGHFLGGEVRETVIPEPDMIVFIPNGVWHGVWRNHGTRPRVAMISTAYPQ